MDIDFIKWMVGYAEGFELIDGGDHEYIKLPNRAGISFEYLAVEKITYPLLLQRAIEGIEEKLRLEILAYKNKRDPGYMAQVFRSEPEDDFPHMEQCFEGFENIDQAKEQALKYIYEQENNENG